MPATWRLVQVRRACQAGFDQGDDHWDPPTKMHINLSCVTWLWAQDHAIGLADGTRLQLTEDDFARIEHDILIDIINE